MNHSPEVNLLVRVRGILPTAAWVGFLGACILAVGRIGWMVGGDPANRTGWGRRVAEALPKDSAGPITVLGVTVMLLAILLRGECKRDRPRFWTVFIAWALPILPLAGVLSSDARYYSDIGWMVSRGYDP